MSKRDELVEIISPLFHAGIKPDGECYGCQHAAEKILAWHEKECVCKLTTLNWLTERWENKYGGMEKSLEEVRMVWGKVKDMKCMGDEEECACKVFHNSPIPITNMWQAINNLAKSMGWDKEGK